MSVKLVILSWFESRWTHYGLYTCMMFMISFLVIICRYVCMVGNGMNQQMVGSKTCLKLSFE